MSASATTPQPGSQRADRLAHEATARATARNTSTACNCGVAVTFSSIGSFSTIRDSSTAGNSSLFGASSLPDLHGLTAKSRAQNTSPVATSQPTPFERFLAEKSGDIAWFTHADQDRLQAIQEILNNIDECPEVLPDGYEGVEGKYTLMQELDAIIEEKNSNGSG